MFLLHKATMLKSAPPFLSTSHYEFNVARLYAQVQENIPSVLLT